MFTIKRSTGDISVKLPQLSYIYRFFCRENKMAYVGKTQNVERRLQQHLNGEGSKLLLSDLVEYGRKAFDIEILEVLSSDDLEKINQAEDAQIEKNNCLMPNGYNKRLNRTLTKNSTQDLSNIEIHAKYVFSDRNHIYFTIGACSQARSYQTLLNCGDLHGLTKKRQFNFDYLEIKFPKFDYPFTPSCIYNMTIKYERGFKILEVWDAV